MQQGAAGPWVQWCLRPRDADVSLQWLCMRGRRVWGKQIKIRSQWGHPSVTTGLGPLREMWIQRQTCMGWGGQDVERWEDPSSVENVQEGLPEWPPEGHRATSWPPWRGGSALMPGSGPPGPHRGLTAPSRAPGSHGGSPPLLRVGICLPRGFRPLCGAGSVHRPRESLAQTSAHVQTVFPPAQSNTSACEWTGRLQRLTVCPSRSAPFLGYHRRMSSNKTAGNQEHHQEYRDLR